ncbi:protein of unknown function (plasmid) [Rhodovastum atsumiense]|nr:protein of unknown function [Rhodovastum atsumiense]
MPIFRVTAIAVRQAEAGKTERGGDDVGISLSALMASECPHGLVRPAPHGQGRRKAFRRQPP